MVRVFILCCMMLLSINSYSDDFDSFSVGLEAGFAYTDVQLKEGGSFSRQSVNGKEVKLIFGFRAYGLYSGKHEVGAGVQYLEPDGKPLYAIKAVEYGYRFYPQLIGGAFFGLARYDTGLSSMGYYMGARLELRNGSHEYGISLEFSYADSLERDRLLPSDPSGSGDFFYDIYSLNLSANYYF